MKGPSLNVEEGPFFRVFSPFNDDKKPINVMA
jgi:hypothetical protein